MVVNKRKTNHDFHLKDLLGNVASQCEDNLVKWAVHPFRPEWWTAAQFGIGDDVYRITFDKDYDMANVREGTIVRAIGIVLRHFTREDCVFERKTLDMLLSFTDDLFDTFACQYYANGEKASLYHSFAEAYGLAGNKDTAKQLENDAQEWDEWSKEEHFGEYSVSDFHVCCAISKNKKADIQLHIANCYDKGKEVHRSEKLANIWFGLAANNGSEEAQQVCEKRLIDWETIWW